MNVALINTTVSIQDRPDFIYIASLIPEGSRVLDLGCGTGELLAMLREKGVKAQGIEKNEICVIECMKKGLYVHHGDIDDGLSHHLDKSFDYVILNQTIQQTVNPGKIIKDSLRIGKNVILVFPNFGFYQIRFSILFTGKTPVTELMPYHWYDTPNLHFLSVQDFELFAKTNRVKILKTAFFHKRSQVRFFPNFFSSLSLYILQDLP